jgi:hypothetical protein
VEQFLYYRSLSRSAAIWREGKDIKNFPSETSKKNYLANMKEGRGFPSIWMSSNNEDLEKIALGLMLCKKSLDKIEFIGLDKCCFEKTKINIVQAPDLQFPLPSVSHCHHELRIDNDADLDTNLMDSIELFLHCNGDIKRFPRSADSVTDPSILNIAKKYIGEISGEVHVNKANEWIEKYGKQKTTEN